VRNVGEDVLAHVRIVSFLLLKQAFSLFQFLMLLMAISLMMMMMFYSGLFKGVLNLSWILNNNNNLLLVNAVESLVLFLCCIEIDMDIFL
jgi:hypothetical protein